MCQDCEDWETALRRRQSGPPSGRDVPRSSGEAAIYSLEYLIRKEGNAIGTDPAEWRERLPRG